MEFNFALIITATINPKKIPFLKRTSQHDRLNDYISSFNKWCKSPFIKDIIFVENSGYDLSFFRECSKHYPKKRIEIISTDKNNSFDKKLGKGYGEYLCFNEIIKKSNLIKKNNFFLKVSGRYFVKNFKQFIQEFLKYKPDMYVNLKDNLKFADSHIFGGSTIFFSKYILLNAKKINDTKGIFMEHCLAQSVLEGIVDGLNFKNFRIYPNIEGIIGTNNKKIKTNFIKLFRNNFYLKIKKKILENKKY